MADLHQFNHALGNIDLRVEPVEGYLPTAIIVGLPRTGSTLLQQVMISRYQLAYISNLTAKFYKNPAAGTLVHENLVPKDYSSDFLSAYGNTSGVFEPSEFGWFWQDQLQLDQHDVPGQGINWACLNTHLSDIKSVAKKPLIIDNPYLCSYIGEIKTHLKDVKILHLQRDLWNVCNSMLNARIQRYGKLDEFFGAKPRSFANLLKMEDPVEQVVQQVHDLQQDINDGLAIIDPKDILSIDITDLRAEPEEVASRVNAFLGGGGIAKSNSISPFPDRDQVPSFDPAFSTILQRYCQDILGVQPLWS